MTPAVDDEDSADDGANRLRREQKRRRVKAFWIETAHDAVSRGGHHERIQGAQLFPLPLGLAGSRAASGYCFSNS